MGCVWNFLIESCGYIAKSRVSRCNSKFDLHPGPKVGQLFSRIHLLFYFLFPKFQPIILPLFSNSTMQPHKNQLPWLVLLNLTLKLLYFFAYNAMCKALQSSLCPFKAGISGYSNLRTMSTGSYMGNFRAYNKSLGQTAPYVILLMHLNKADNFTYYSKSDLPRPGLMHAMIIIFS